MNTDCRATRRFNAIKQTLTPFTGKTLTLGLALILGACASTADKSGEMQTADAPQAESKAPAKTTEPASSEPAPTAAELMKTLQAPLKEPEPVNSSKASTQPASKKAVAEPDSTADAASDVTKSSAGKTAVAAESATVKTAETAPKKAASVTSSAVKEPAPQAESAVKKVEAVVEQKAPVAAAEVVSTLDAKPFSVTAKQLPFTYDIWTIRKGNTSLTDGLVIVTPTWEMGKEGYMSQIWLTLMEDKIHVNSSSDIETASKGLGIRIDGGDLIPFSSVAETNIGVIEGRWLDRLAKADKVDIYLGFFPGKKPTSDTFKSDLSLSNLDRIVATYRLLHR